MKFASQSSRTGVRLPLKRIKKETLVSLLILLVIINVDFDITGTDNVSYIHHILGGEGGGKSVRQCISSL